MSTLVENWLSKATDEELREASMELQELVMAGGLHVEGWRRILRAVQAEQGRRIAATTPPGCCTNCAGTGQDAGAPETGGLCWECHGTGHDHADLEPTDQCPAVE